MALGLIAQEQVDNAKLVADMETQGVEKPNDPGAFKMWLCQQSEAIVVCAMGDGPFVEVIHSLVQYVSPGQVIDPNNNKIISALGDLDKNGKEPVYVRIWESAFDWKSVNQLKEGGGEQRRWQLFSTNPTTGDSSASCERSRSATTVPIPQLPLVLVSIGARLAKSPTTSGELKRLLVTFAESKSEEVQALLAPTIAWVHQASLHEQTKGES
jgi:hypothetical protein